jgi:peptidoglycan/LPS O-acetylase OafA/YrhL
VEAQRPIARIAFIDGLRGVAILAVIFHHSFGGVFNAGVGTSHTSLLSDIASSGFLGVNLFFVLSGFVLYLPYVVGSRHMDERGGVRRYLKARGRRLLPLYYFMCAVSLLFVLGRPASRAFLVWAFLHATVLFPFHPKTFLPSANWVMWSLGVEIWFSVLFPLLVWLAARYSLVTLLIGTATTGILVRAIGYADRVPALSSGTTYFLSNSVLGRLDDFVFGMLAAGLYAARVKTGGVARWWAVATAAVLTIAVCRLWSMSARHEIPVVWASLFSLPLNVAFVLIIQEMAGWPALAAVFENWTLRLIGMMCYSIYLWHGIVLIRFPETNRLQPGPYSTYLSIVFVLSWFTYRYIEFPRASSYRDVLPRTS